MRLPQAMQCDGPSARCYAATHANLPLALLIHHLRNEWLQNSRDYVDRAEKSALNLAISLVDKIDERLRRFRRPRSIMMQSQIDFARFFQLGRFKNLEIPRHNALGQNGDSHPSRHRGAYRAVAGAC